MPLKTSEIIEGLKVLAERNNLKASVNEAGKGACIAGICTFIGALAGGPAGMAIGGILGSTAAAFNSRGKFKSVAHIISYELTDDQKDRLATHVRNAMSDVGVEDVIFITQLLSRGKIQSIVITELGKFLQNELSYALMQ